MMHISILVPESSVIQAIADPQYLFNTVNQFYAMSGKSPAFEVQLVGFNKEVRLNGGCYTVRCDRLTGETNKTDLIIIPALFGDMNYALAQNKDLIPWILHHYANGAEVASLCVGAFLLAATGLVKDKKCSTHWGFASELKEMYPEVNVVDGKIVTEENRIYSSGGASSYWNLLL